MLMIADGDHVGDVGGEVLHHVAPDIPNLFHLIFAAGASIADVT